MDLTMSDKDIKVQQILYELGYKQEQSLTEQQEQLFQQAIDPDEQFLAQVEELFSKSDNQ